MFKLLLSWNIRPGREDECFEFLMRELGPGLMRLGVHPTDAWYTQYGSGPQVLQGGVSEDLAALQRALASEEWRKIRQKLSAYVTDYQQKIVRASGEFQL